MCGNTLLGGSPKSLSVGKTYLNCRPTPPHATMSSRSRNKKAMNREESSSSDDDVPLTKFVDESDGTDSDAPIRVRNTEFQEFLFYLDQSKLCFNACFRKRSLPKLLPRKRQQKNARRKRLHQKRPRQRRQQRRLLGRKNLHQKRKNLKRLTRSLDRGRILRLNWTQSAFFTKVYIERRITA